MLVVQGDGGSGRIGGRNMGGAGEAYVVYVDVQAVAFALDVLFDYLLLWATGEILRLPSRKLRRATAAVFGAIYSTVHQLAQVGIISGQDVWASWPLVVVASLCMVAVAFGRVPLRRLAALLGTFYTIGFVAGGAGLAFTQVVAAGARTPLLGSAVATGFILAIAELGWGLVHKHVWHGLYEVPLTVSFGGAHVRVPAIVDTGNRLEDPVTRAPVVIMEFGDLKPVLPPAFAAAEAALKTGDVDTFVMSLADEPGWSTRLRLIPFASIGKERGMLVGLKPDRVYIESGGRELLVPSCVIGLHDRPLDAAGRFRALVHPAAFQAAGSSGQSEGRPSGQLANNEQRGDSLNVPTHV